MEDPSRPRREAKELKKKKPSDTILIVSEIEADLRWGREENHSYPLDVLSVASFPVIH